ncbi:MAG: hypothetical protein PVSMB1_11300 [Gemmatimonadaceae bacterium]
MNKRMMVLVSMVILAATARLLPHFPNVTPIAAMALFGGAYVANRWLAYLLPLAAMLVSDLVLGYTLYGTTLLHSQPIVYLCVMMTVAMGKLIRDRRSPRQVGSVTLGSSVAFFIVTNFAVWADGSLYPRTWPGLVSCYTAAIPFFRNSVAGDMTFAVVLFGGFALLEAGVPSLREKRKMLPA